MKKLIAFTVLSLSMMCANSAYAIDIKDLLGMAGEVVEGVLTKTDITVEDMAGVWTVEGSAVSFKSDNALAKAGGIAAAAAIEQKLDPYYERYGLTGGEFTINADGTFTLALKRMTLSGTVVKNEKDGTFDFKFSALGSIPVGSLTAYVQKPVNKLEIMFDATKLKTLISVVAKYSGMSMAKTASSLLDSYDGLCVGFSMSKTGEVKSATGTGTKSDTSTDSDSSTPSLFDLLKRRR